MKVLKIEQNGVVELIRMLYGMNDKLNTENGQVIFRVLGEKYKQVLSDVSLLMVVECDIFSLEILSYLTPNISIKEYRYQALPFSNISVDDRGKFNEDFPDLFSTIVKHSSLLSDLKSNISDRLKLNGSHIYKVELLFNGIYAYNICNVLSDERVLATFSSIKDDDELKLKLGTLFFENIVNRFYTDFYQFDQRRDIISDYILHENHLKKIGSNLDQIIISSINSPVSTVDFGKRDTFSDQLNKLKDYLKLDQNNDKHVKIKYVVGLTMLEYVFIKLYVKDISIIGEDKNGILYHQNYILGEIDDNTHLARINSTMAKLDSIKKELVKVETDDVLHPSHVSNIYGLTYSNQKKRVLIELDYCNTKIYKDTLISNLAYIRNTDMNSIINTISNIENKHIQLCSMIEK